MFRHDDPNGDEDAIVGTTNTAGKSGVFGFNPARDGNGVAGISDNGNGVFAKSKTSNGIFGESETGLGVHGHSFNHVGVFGISDKDDGVVGVAKSPEKSGVFGRNESDRSASAPGGSGVFGLTVAKNAAGVFGANNHAESGRGVQGNGPEAGVGGFSEDGVGVRGDSNKGDGVTGFCHAPDRNGVFGRNDPDPKVDAPAIAPGGNGVFGFSMVKGGAGVFGANNRTDSGRGVQGNGHEAGVGGFSGTGSGVLAQSNTGIGILAQAAAGGRAGRFEGKVEITSNLDVVTGTVTCKDLILTNEDCAEDFDIASEECIEPGMVMVIDKDGLLCQSRQPYDKRVAGVISGGGEFRPGVTLGKQPSKDNRLPVALVGKVFCKADAEYSPILVGDLLTTSRTPGHAMRADDPARAFGAVIGKALRPLKTGRGLIPILIALQ